MLLNVRLHVIVHLLAGIIIAEMNALGRRSGVITARGSVAIPIEHGHPDARKGLENRIDYVVRMNIAVRPQESVAMTTL